MIMNTNLDVFKLDKYVKYGLSIVKCLDLMWLQIVGTTSSSISCKKLVRDEYLYIFCFQEFLGHLCGHVKRKILNKDGPWPNTAELVLYSSST